MSNLVSIDRASSKKRYLAGIGILLVFLAACFIVLRLTARSARNTVELQLSAERTLEAPGIRFLEAAPNFHRPFTLAMDRNFAVIGPDWNASPALSYLDKKSISTKKLAEQYATLWRLLEQLQLQRDFVFEERVLRMFLTASSSEVMEAMGGSTLVSADDFSQYQFLSEQGLAWYLQHYYLDPATALSHTHQYWAARNLVYNALHRLHFRPIPLSRYLRIPEYDRVMLLAAVFSRPQDLIGRDETVQLLLKTILDDFPPAARFEIESHSFANDLAPLKMHMLGIYALRNRDFDTALKYFNDSIKNNVRNYHRDLASYMGIRTRFWQTHSDLVRRKTVLSKIQADRFSQELEEQSTGIHAPNLRANVREYIEMVRTDLTVRSGLVPKVRPAVKKQEDESKQPMPLPRVPAIEPIFPTK